LLEIKEKLADISSSQRAREMASHRDSRREVSPSVPMDDSDALYWRFEQPKGFPGDLIEIL
jgi:hypothetical protein